MIVTGWDSACALAAALERHINEHVAGVVPPEAGLIGAVVASVASAFEQKDRGSIDN